MTAVKQARRKTKAPANRKQVTGQRSLDFDPYLVRRPYTLRRPSQFSAENWRSFVLGQQLATLAKESIVSHVLNLDWAISPVDPNMRDELREDIKHYTTIFTYNGELDYTNFIEWILNDYLDLPVGSATELLFEDDDPQKKLLHFIPLDGGTIFPWKNPNFPLGQIIERKEVYFPFHAINRIYMTPRREYYLRGWGMAPPEKIYLAMDLLSKGDQFYSNLLTDTPEAGILDLGDMSEASAARWLEAFKELMTGIDPLKIPVLYEHNTQVKFIPFNLPPSEMLYDSTTLKYAAIVAGGYGVFLSDIGVTGESSNGGETLAGTIRQERASRRMGKGKAKNQVTHFYNRMLPEGLEFVFIDPDEEQTVARGRALLSTSTSAQQLVEAKIFTNNEMRQQMVADGLITVPVPENVPEEEFIESSNESGELNSQRRLVPENTPPSEGGTGEVRLSTFLDVALSSIFDYQSLSDILDQYDLWEPGNVEVLLSSYFDTLSIDPVQYEIFAQELFSKQLESLQSKIPFVTYIRQKPFLEKSDQVLGKYSDLVERVSEEILDKARNVVISSLLKLFSLDTISDEDILKILEDFNKSRSDLLREFNQRIEHGIER